MILEKPKTEKERLLIETLIGKPGPNSRFVGMLDGKPFFEDPDVEDGVIYFINQEELCLN